MFKIDPYKSRRLREINVYRLYNNGSNIRKQWKKMNLKEFKQHFKIEGDTKVIGFTPDYVGYRPSKCIYFHNHIAEAIVKDESIRIESGFNDEIVESCIEYREVWSGGFDTNGGHLTEFFKQREILKELTADDILLIIKDCPWFSFPKVTIDNPEEMYDVINFNPLSHPGHYFSKLLKTNFKRDTIVNAYMLALELYEEIRSKPQKNYCLWDVLSREKDIKVDSSKEPSTRVVMNPEHHVTMILGWVFQKFITLCNSGGNHAKFLIEKEYDAVKAKKLLDNIVFKYDFVVDADWSWFDSTQSSEYLLAALSCMFSNSIETKEDMRFFYWIAETTITKYVAVPPGIVVELNHGMPSGHPGVTAINCVVNLIRWAVLGYHIYGPRYWEHMDLTVYGDDAFVGMNYSPFLKNIDKICSDHGFIGDNIYDRLFPSYLYFSEIHNIPDFLKRRFDLHGIYWNRKKLVDKIIYQSRKRSFGEQVDLLLGFIQTAPCDSYMNEFIFKIIHNMFKNYSEKVDNTLIDKVNKTVNFNKERFIIGVKNDTFDGYHFSRNVESANQQIYLPHLPENIFNDALYDFEYEDQKLLWKFLFNIDFNILKSNNIRFLILKRTLNKYFFKYRKRTWVARRARDDLLPIVGWRYKKKLKYLFKK